MALEQIMSLLGETTGLHAPSIGTVTVANAVSLRMQECGIDSMREYLARLDHAPEEFDALVDAVVVLETWFFRDEEPFAALQRYVRQTWLPDPRRQRLRILSVPCSTGEEPYSIAMCLLDAGLAYDSFRIVAIDISSQAIEAARRGTYGPYSFRGKRNDYRDKYFSRTGENYQLHDHVRDCVRFFQGNILGDTLRAERDCYDIIFCRNLLIYFDQPTQLQVFYNLERLLTQNGLLFLGHADTGNVPTHSFRSLKWPKAFAYSREDREATRNSPQDILSTRRAMPEPKQQPAPVPPAVRPFANVVPLPDKQADSTGDEDDMLVKARELADLGQLNEARELCESRLREDASNADAHYLLGLINIVNNEFAQSEIHLRKALYLQPEHYEGLVLLSLLTEQNGDSEGAQQLRRRAKRVYERSNSTGDAR